MFEKGKTAISQKVTTWWKICRPGDVFFQKPGENIDATVSVAEGCFYETFYESQGNTIPPYNKYFQIENDTVLDCNESANCEGFLSEKECLEALKDMDPEKASGTEFYETFWDELAFSLIRVSRLWFDWYPYSAYDQGTLSVSQRQGIINLYQKGR